MIGEDEQHEIEQKQQHKREEGRTKNKQLNFSPNKMKRKTSYSGGKHQQHGKVTKKKMTKKKKK